MQKTLVLGECKWTLAEVGRPVLKELIEEKTFGSFLSTAIGASITWAFRAAAGKKKPWPTKRKSSSGRQLEEIGK